MLRTGQEQCGNFPEGPNYYCWVEQGYDSGPVFEERITGVFVSDCSLSKAEYTEANLDDEHPGIRRAFCASGHTEDLY
jgi:hypothetical protein